MPRKTGITPRGLKAKGDRYERDLAEYLNTHVFGGRPQVQRALLSGGGRWRKTDNTIAAYAGDADLEGTPHLFVEAKRVERFNIHATMKQLTRNCDVVSPGSIPVAITRRSNQPLAKSYCVLHLEDFAQLYRALLLMLDANEREYAFHRIAKSDAPSDPTPTPDTDPDDDLGF